MFNPLFSSTNQQLFKKRTFVIKVATIDDFYSKWKPSHAIDTFRGEQRWIVNKDEWDTKEGRGKSMKNALHVQQYGKGTSRAEATLNSEPLLSYVSLKASGRQAVS